MGDKNFKGLLITFCLKNGKSLPRFETPNQTGPPHDRIFTCEVFIDDKLMGEAKDKKRKSAENNAAKMALEAVGKREIVHQPDYIALLNEFCQKLRYAHSFEEVCRTGPSHSLEFVYRVKIEDRNFPESGKKKTKKVAKKEAAYLALRVFREESPDDIPVLPEAFIDESGSESSSLSGSAGDNSLDRGSESGLAQSAAADSECPSDYISLLMQFCQKKRWVYNFVKVEQTGASHNLQFAFRVNTGDRNFPESGKKKTIKLACKEAAFLALKELIAEFPNDIPQLPKEFIDDSMITQSSVSSPGNTGLNRRSSESGFANSPTPNSKSSSPSSWLTPTNPQRQRLQNGLAHPEPTHSETTSSSGISSGSENPQSSLDEFTNVTELDKGAFGKVVKAKKILDDKYYAVKIVHVRDKKYVQEVKALAVLEHQNIVRYYNAWWGQDYFSDSSESSSSSSDLSKKPKACLFIQMELCENGSLKTWIKKRNLSGDVDKNKSLEIFRQINEGVKYIHSEKHIHRDLKPANIFFTKDMIVKIGDFGLVTRMTGEHESQALQRTQGTGTPSYMAPEQKEENMYENEVDIYALGLILVELLWIFGTGHERAVEWMKLRKGELSQKFVESYPSEEYEIKKILSIDPKKRPSAADLKIAFEPNMNFNSRTR